MDDETDEFIQLTVKHVPKKIRTLMNQLAEKRGQVLGEWLTAMVLKAAEMQAGDLVSPAAFVPAPLQVHGPAAVPFSMTELRDTMQALGAVAEASGRPIPKRTAGLAYSVVRLKLLEVLQPPVPKKGQSKPKVKLSSVEPGHTGHTKLIAG